MPPENFIMLTERTTVTLMTPAGVWIISKKTGEVVEFIPEMPILRQFDAITAAGNVLSNTQHLKGTEELRLEAGKFIASFIEKANEAIAPRAEKHAA